MNTPFLRYATRNALVAFLVVVLLTALVPAALHYDQADAFLRSWQWIVFDKLLGVFAVAVAGAVFFASLRGPRKSKTPAQSSWTMGRHGQFMQDGYDVQGRPFGLEDD